MNGARRFAAIGLVIALAAGLGACGGDDEDDGDGAGTTTAAAAPEATAAPAESSAAPTDEGSGEDVELTFWTHTHPPMNDLLEKLITEYEDAHPNVTINYEKIPNNDFGTKMLGSPRDVARICLGLTGAPALPAERDRLAELIRRRTGAAQVLLGPDMVTAHAGALGGEPGVVLASGTGTVCLGLAPDGAAHSADGAGYLVGDDGSGFAIGQAGLRAAVRARDGRGPATELAAAAADAFGDLWRLGRTLATAAAPVREVASFAPRVAEAARAGDDVARRIWADAAEQLAATTAAVVTRTCPEPQPDGVAVSYTGALFDVADLLLDPYLAALARRSPASRVRTPLGGSLDGAARLVSAPSRLHGGLLRTIGAPSS